MITKRVLIFKGIRRRWLKSILLIGYFNRSYLVSFKQLDFVDYLTTVICCSFKDTCSLEYCSFFVSFAFIC